LNNKTNNDYEYWKNYRIKLTDSLKQEEKVIPKTKENIYKMYMEYGLHATSRYFNIANSQVMYYVKQVKNNNN